MNVFRTHSTLKKHLRELKPSSLGLVPTMGALHRGHLKLVEIACKKNPVVVVSIFVNPTQFDDQNDLENYPKTFDNDIKKLLPFTDQVIIYAPEVSDLYPAHDTRLSYALGDLETVMEGASRKGHFQGVATVVHKLFACISPTHAYFGEKDFQQLKIIQRLVELHQLNITIVPCPIIREEDGLAMSSRNTRLSESERFLAPEIFKQLQKAKTKKSTHSLEKITADVEQFFHNHSHLKLDYFSITDAQTLTPLKQLQKGKEARAFIAVKLGEVRLIDNIKF